MFNGIRQEPEFRQIVSDLETKYQSAYNQVGKWIEEEKHLL